MLPTKSSRNVRSLDLDSEKKFSEKYNHVKNYFVKKKILSKSSLQYQADNTFLKLYEVCKSMKYGLIIEWNQKIC